MIYVGGEVTKVNDDRLLEFYREWQAAQQHAQTAQQIASGAQNDATLKEARFKGAAELLHGPAATFEFKDGKLMFKVPK